MASISVGGEGGKKALDSAIPLVPFIDLLLCCVMFLLVTAVWNQLGSLETRQRVPGLGLDTPDVIPEALTLTVHRDGFEVSSLAGDRKALESEQEGELRETLVAFRAAHVGATMTVAAEDGVPYARLIRALDLARDVGFEQLDVTDAR